jgi:YfiH family protein
LLFRNNPILLIPGIFKPLHIVAAQSTRLGGLSVSPYNELNLGFSSGDDLEIIKQNRKLFFDALGISENNIAWSKLVHSNKVLVADKPMKGEGCDAVITNQPNVFACVSIADCTPVLIYDPKQKAVAAIHAGWRGTVAKIVTETLKAMQTNYGTRGENCLAFVGACIGEKNFEVGDEVAVQFSSDVKRFDPEKKKYFVDLKKENKKQLLDFGLKESNIEISNYCTITDNDKFFSYRKEKGVTGRMLAVIGMKK